MLGNGKKISALARGFRKRTLVTARLAAKTGLKALAKTINPDRQGGEVDEEHAVRAATQLAETMGEMKGLVMKLGQMASYLEGSMPPAAQRVMAQLQAESTPLTFEAAAAIIDDDLGAAPDELFERFEREPFAAASLGQVHRAVHDGVPVAVKVQYPEIAAVLQSDIRTLGTFAKFGTLLSAVDGGGLVDELQERIVEECDYVKEAASQQEFATLLEDIDGASVPAVFDDRSGPRVITSAFSPARPFKLFCEQASQAERDRAAAIVFDVCFSTIFEHGVFNADPHPGNYLFGEGGDVVFLDFGCIKRFSPEHIENWKRLALCLLDADRASFRKCAMDMDLVVNERGFDWDYYWSLARFLYEPFTTPGFRFTGDYVKSTYDRLMFKNPNRFRQTIPKEQLFVNRLQWGLYSVLASLDGEADWGSMLRRAIAGTPRAAKLRKARTTAVTAP